MLTRLVAFFACLLLLLALTGCFGKGNSIFDDHSSIDLDFKDPHQDVDLTQGETMQILVTWQMIATDDGTSRQVILSDVPGLTISPSILVFNLHGSKGDRKSLTVDVTVKADAVAGSREIKPQVVGDTTGDVQFGHNIPFYVQDKLVKVTITPATANIAQGGNQDFVVSLLPRGNTSGNMTFGFATNLPGATVTPS
ncbi:MAG: hypothetical protein ABUL49_00255, partial [bacterium]